MGSQAKDVERLLQLLEEVRLLLASTLPPVRAPRKQLSWEDVWRLAPCVYKTDAKTANVCELV